MWGEKVVGLLKPLYSRLHQAVVRARSPNEPHFPN